MPFENLHAKIAGAVEPADGIGLVVEKRKKEREKELYTFKEMGISPFLIQKLQAFGIRNPSPIQRKTIPRIISSCIYLVVGLKNEDVIAMARTGSGKTVAFLIPVIQILLRENDKIMKQLNEEQDETVKAHFTDRRPFPRCLIICPTRELGEQLFYVCHHLTKGSSLHAAIFHGGTSVGQDLSTIACTRNRPMVDIMIATPGRLTQLVDIIDNKPISDKRSKMLDFSLKNVKHFICDEADQLFERGFVDQIQYIRYRLPRERQNYFFSATMPKQLAQFYKSEKINLETKVVKLDVDTKIPTELQMGFLVVRTEEKYGALLYLLREKLDRLTSQTIVFAPTRYHAEYICSLCREDGMRAGYIFGDMNQELRTRTMNQFKSKSMPLLIVTDVAARGIDVKSLDNVIHFDFPANPKLFIHRSGRVARAGRQGVCYALVDKSEMPYLIDLFFHLGRSLYNFEAAPVIKKEKEDEDEDENEVEYGFGDEDEDENPYGKSFYGGMPKQLMLEEANHVRNLVSHSQNLRSLKEASEKSIRKYNDVKRKPTKRSIRRAKAIYELWQELEIHPWFKDLEKVQTSEFFDKLKNYRPKRGKNILDQTRNKMLSRREKDVISKLGVRGGKALLSKFSPATNAVLGFARTSKDLFAYSESFQPKKREKKVERAFLNVTFGKEEAAEKKKKEKLREFNIAKKRGLLASHPEDIMKGVSNFQKKKFFINPTVTYEDMQEDKEEFSFIPDEVIDPSRMDKEERSQRRFKKDQMLNHIVRKRLRTERRAESTGKTKRELEEARLEKRKMEREREKEKKKRQMGRWKKHDGPTPTRRKLREKLISSGHAHMNREYDARLHQKIRKRKDEALVKRKEGLEKRSRDFNRRFKKKKMMGNKRPSTKKTTYRKIPF